MVVEEQGRTYWCLDCRNVFRLRSSQGICPQCASPAIEFFQGIREMQRESPRGVLYYIADAFGWLSDLSAQQASSRHTWTSGDTLNPYGTQFPPPQLPPPVPPDEDLYTGLSMNEIMAIIQLEEDEAIAHALPASDSSRTSTSPSSSSRASGTSLGSSRTITWFSSSSDSSSTSSCPRRTIDDPRTVKLTRNHINSNPSCTICLKDFQAGSKATELPCKHCFHKDCLGPWIARHSTCPVCRREV